MTATKQRTTNGRHRKSRWGWLPGRARADAQVPGYAAGHADAHQQAPRAQEPGHRGLHPDPAA